MTDVVLSFDCEDYRTPQAADAELWWARNLSERGMRGSLQVVGELVRSLAASGRTDVLAAMEAHEIGFHTDLHSQWPSHPEAVADLSLADGIARILATEADGMATLAKAFRRWPVSYCSPGDSWTPASVLAMARMGVKVFCNFQLEGFSRTPYWYCGMLATHYDFDFMGFYQDDHFAPGRFERAFDDLAARTPDDGVVIIYTHPCRLVTSAFWDAPVKGRTDVRMANCPPAPLRSPAEVGRIQDRCRGWLDWLAGRGDVRVIDFATLYRERAASARDLDALRRESGLPPGAEGDLALRIDGPDAFMPSAAFDQLTYDWLYSAGFTGRSLIEQARRLAWTAAPARKQNLEA